MDEDLFGRGAPRKVLGDRWTRIFWWTITLYVCGGFWMNYTMPAKVVFAEAIGLAVISFLTAYGVYSLIIDLVDDQVKSRFNRFKQIVKNAIKSRKVQP